MKKFLSLALGLLIITYSSTSFALKTKAGTLDVQCEAGKDSISTCAFGVKLSGRTWKWKESSNSQDTVLLTFSGSNALRAVLRSAGFPYTDEEMGVFQAKLLRGSYLFPLGGTGTEIGAIEMEVYGDEPLRIKLRRTKTYGAVPNSGQVRYSTCVTSSTVYNLCYFE